LRPVVETVRTQIPWLKQPTICDAETTYNNSNKKENKEVVTPTTIATPHSALVIAFCCERLGYPIPV
jgi:hypothetical protein